MSPPIIRVVAGLLCTPSMRALVGLRPGGKLRPHMWEYPGGKVEGDEPDHVALMREWHEELGVQVRVGGELCEKRLIVEYDLRWKLFPVEIVSGDLQTLAHAAIDYVDPLNLIQNYPCTPMTYLSFVNVERYLWPAGRP